MALVYGPTIPGYTTGLTFYIDAAIQQSYPGSGTSWNNMVSGAPSGSITNPSFTGKSSNASFYFNGADSWVTIQGGSFALNLGNGNAYWTVNAWVKTTTAATDLGQGSILSNLSGGPVASMMGINNDKIVYWNYDGSWIKNLGSATVNDGLWHQLTWVNNGNTTMTMYVDGVFDADVANSNVGNNPLDGIGKTWAAYYTGNIATLSVYQGTALTEPQVLQNYNALKSRFI